MYNNCKKIYRKSRKIVNHFYNAIIDRKPKLLVLLYHRVLPEIEIKVNPLNTIVRLETFVRQIKLLEKKYKIISLAEAIKQSIEGSIKTDVQAALTFDDGYWDNHEFVLPFLKNKKLPATFFLATEYIGQNKPLWDWEPIAKRYNIKDRCMTWNEVIDLSRNGMEIGAHSLSHRSLSKINFEEAIYEIKKSKKMIEDNIDKQCIHFAFPFGSKEDYSHQLIEVVRGAGFQSCLLNIHGYNHFKKDTFYLKRIIMEEYSDLRYLLG